MKKIFIYQTINLRLLNRNDYYYAYFYNQKLRVESR